MRKLNYRMVVSDFDGTLLTGSHEIPDRVKEAIDEYVASGGIFAVCTGRMLASILPRVRELGLKGLVVAYQGTVIAEIESGRLLKCGGMSAEDAAVVCRALEDEGAYVNVYSDEKLYTDIAPDNIYLKEYERITGVKSVYVPAPISEFVLKRKLFCRKITSLVARSKRDTLYEKLCEKLSDRFDVTYSADVLVEISPYGDDKGAALEFLAAHFGVPLTETVAIGDNLNDLSMIKAAGKGVAVGNASPLLKEAADVVTVTNDEGAVAEIIEKYGFA